MPSESILKPDMLREAEKALREQGFENVEWIRGSSAELLTRALGGFDLVTIGTAFHYMDPSATLGELAVDRSRWRRRGRLQRYADAADPYLGEGTTPHSGEPPRAAGRRRLHQRGTSRR